MKVTKTEDSALRLAIGLARLGEQATLLELAIEAGLSEALSAKILGTLRRGGVVRVVRGRNGRYELAEPANRITVARVIRALGLPLFHGCLATSEPIRSAECPNQGECGLRPIWHYLEAEVTHLFERITLADLLESEHSVQQQVAQIAAALAKPKGFPLDSLEPIGEAVEASLKNEDHTYDTEG